jgi:hypothetical protein
VYRTKIRPRAKKIILGILGLFVLFTIVGFFVLPPIVKYVLVTQLSKSLHRTVAIERIRINPYALSATVKGLVIKERADAETFVSCNEIFVNLQSLSALKLAPMLKEAKIVKPYIRIVRNKDLTYNFSDLLEGPSSEPMKFAVNNISIKDGSVDFVDGPVEKKHMVREMTIGIPFISNIPSYVQRFVRPHFSAKIDDALYTIDGQTTPFADSHETSLNITIKDIDLPFYMAYLPINTRFTLKAGKLDVGAKIAFVETKENKPSLTVSGDVSVKTLAVNDAEDRTFFQLPLLQVAIAPSEPLLKAIHLSSVTIQSPEFAILRDKDKSINVLSLLPEADKNKEAPKETGGPVQFSLDIDQIRLTGGKFSFSDLSGSKPFKTVLDPTEASVDHFSMGRDKKTAYSLSTRTEVKETVKIEGEFSMDPLWLEGVVDVASVPVKKYSPYYSDQIPFTIEDGRVDLSTRYRYTAGQREPEVALSGISLSLNALRLRKPGDNVDFLTVPTLSVKEGSLDPAKKLLTIGNFSTQKGTLSVKRLANGDVDLAKLIPTPPTDTGPDRKPFKNAEPAKKPATPETPWVVSLKAALIDNYSVRMTDQTTPEPVTLTAQIVRVKGENISTARNSKAKVAASLLLNDRGSIAAEGTFGVDPMLANLKVNLKGIGIASFQPYFEDKVNVTVTGGAFSANGGLSLSTDPKGGMKVTYDGEAALVNFSSIDKSSGDDLLKLESLSLTGMGVKLDPFSINIKGVALTNFYSLVSVNSDGRINLQDAFSPENPASPPSAPSPAAQAATPATVKSEPPKDIKIETVTLQGGRIDFRDNSIKPEFSTRLSEIGGRVSGLSADRNTTADVDLRGKLNDYAPLEITGKINPLREDLFVDLKARIVDLDLSPATPYSGKYAGYTIEKGKLSLDVKYSISGRKVDSTNDILIDQFSFGQKVESADATKLPVKLAVALLKDRRGVIKLDLPVTGSLDDPKFSIWRVVLKIIVNLIAKAATSPFALLGAAFGGGEELSHVEFDYGSALVTDANRKKIATLAKALHDRPTLKVDVEGHVDVEKDRDALRQLLFNRKLKVQKLNEMTKKGLPVPPVDEVAIEPAEREKFLTLAYKAEKFPKPKDFLGMAKNIPPSEMEKLMLTHTEVTDGDLRTLASQRAITVKDALLKSGQVEAERIFIVEPKLTAPEKKEKLKDSRVDFTLK